jgi:hypothetical protein
MISGPGEIIRPQEASPMEKNLRVLGPVVEFMASAYVPLHDQRMEGKADAWTLTWH